MKNTIRARKAATYIFDTIPWVYLDNARKAIVLAESEAHDRAIEAFKRCCQYRTDILCSDLDHRSNECNSDCVGVKNFIDELNK